jgi:hypothetical protein
MLNKISLLIIIVLTIVSVNCQFKHPHKINIEDLDNSISSNNVGWSKSECSKSEVCVTAYLRLVKYLFRSERFLQTRQGSYQATINLKVKQDQYDLIMDEAVDGLNINEIESLLNEIVSQSTNFDIKQQREIMIEIFRQEALQYIQSILHNPIFLGVMVISTLFILSRFIKFTKLSLAAVILLAIIVMILFSFGIAYTDCLHDLEVQEIIKMQQIEDKNPCISYKNEGNNFYSTMFTRMFGSSEDACHKHLKKVLTKSKKICDPLKVFTSWIAQIQMLYFGSIIENFVLMLQQLTKSSGFFGMIIWSLLGGGLLIMFILGFGKETIRTFIPEVFKLLKSSTIETNNNQREEEMREENERLKHENRILRELSMERTLPVKSISKEVKEIEKDPKPLENIPEEICDKQDIE